VRFRLPADSRGDTDLRSISDALQGANGTRRVHANPVTGSILVLHRGPASTEEFTEVLRSRGFEVDDRTNGRREKASGQREDLAAGIESAVRDLNARVERATDGRMDLRTVVPLALLTGGLIKLMFDENWKAVPPYVLLYYAFDTYWKLNDRSAGRRNKR
jgi:hypothetical protein